MQIWCREGECSADSHPAYTTAIAIREFLWDGSSLPPPPGLLFHAAVGYGELFFPVTVWETRE